MKIKISSNLFDPLEEIKLYQQQMNQAGKFGASAFFIGSMRDRNDGEAILSMEIEHYPGMTEKHLIRIAEAASQRWSLIDSLVIHRVGVVNIADPIVLVAVWSEHRSAAFEASRFIMEDLKNKAPFWKKEITKHEQRWVRENTPGYSD